MTAKNELVFSKKEFTDLQRLGMEYGVNVIPEIKHSCPFIGVHSL